MITDIEVLVLGLGEIGWSMVVNYTVQDFNRTTGRPTIHYRSQSHSHTVAYTTRLLRVRLPPNVQFSLTEVNWHWVLECLDRVRVQPVTWLIGTGPWIVIKTKRLSVLRCGTHNNEKKEIYRLLLPSMLGTTLQQSHRTGLCCGQRVTQCQWQTVTESELLLTLVPYRLLWRPTPSLR